MLHLIPTRPGNSFLAETLFQKLFGKRYFVPLCQSEARSNGNPGFPQKSQEIPEIPGFPGNPRIWQEKCSPERFLAGFSLKSGQKWPQNRPETAPKRSGDQKTCQILGFPQKSMDFLGFPIRAPIDHFLRGKCDKCPPRVRRVKSGFPKNGHASANTRSF